MNGLILPVRTERRSAPRGSPPPQCGADEALEPPADPALLAQVAAQPQAFDYETAERAEVVREHDVLEPLVVAHLKN